MLIFRNRPQTQHRNCWQSASAFDHLGRRFVVIVHSHSHRSSFWTIFLQEKLRANSRKIGTGHSWNGTMCWGLWSAHHIHNICDHTNACMHAYIFKNKKYVQMFASQMSFERTRVPSFASGSRGTAAMDIKLFLIGCVIVISFACGSIENCADRDAIYIYLCETERYIMRPFRWQKKIPKRNSQWVISVLVVGQHFLISDRMRGMQSGIKNQSAKYRMGFIANRTFSGIYKRNFKLYWIIIMNVRKLKPSRD